MDLHPSLEFPLWVENLNGAWRSILHSGQLRKFSKGTLVHCNNAENPGFYFLDEGMVKLLLYPSNIGQPCSIFIIKENCLFGEIPEFSQILNATFECLTNCKTYFFPFDKIFNENFASKYPSIMLELARSLSIKSHRITGLLIQREKFTANINVARYLYTIDKYTSEKNNYYFSHNELASLLGIHRSTLSAILKELKELNILERYTKKKIVIQNKDKLIEYILTYMNSEEVRKCNIKNKEISLSN